MNLLFLGDYRHLFLDDASYEEFVEAVAARMDDFSPVISQGRVLGMLLSPEATRKILCERILRRTTPRLLTVPEAAERLAVLPARLARWARSGQVPVFFLPDGEARFSPADLDDWIARNRRPDGEGDDQSADLEDPGT